MSRPRVIASGTDRAVVRLPSGEYLAVDTNSIDAINYLLGRPVEPNVGFVFRCFLHPNAVVLDIGANFGLYSAITASVIRRRGRLFAFEPNPHTFGLLARTVYANGVINNPNIVLVNKAVGRCSGHAALHYIDQALSGASLHEPPYFANGEIQSLGIEPRTIKVETTTIDDYLPAELAVHLAKIDVEGHEPHVLMGMEQTIRRSAEIRIIVEYIEDLLRHTLPAREFIDYIRGLGLHICLIRKDWRLELYERGAVPPDNCYLLLTRSPETDLRTVARRRNAPRRWLKRALQGVAIDIGELSHRL